MRKVFQQNHRPALSIFLGMFFSLLISVNPMINRVYIKYKSDCGGDNNQTGAIGAGWKSVGTFDLFFTRCIDNQIKSQRTESTARNMEHNDGRFAVVCTVKFCLETIYIVAFIFSGKGCTFFVVEIRCWLRPILWEITLLSVAIGVFLMQILTLGSKINKRFGMRNCIKI